MISHRFASDQLQQQHSTHMSVTAAARDPRRAASARDRNRSRSDGGQVSRGSYALRGGFSGAFLATIGVSGGAEVDRRTFEAGFRDFERVALATISVLLNSPMLFPFR